MADVIIDNGMNNIIVKTACVVAAIWVGGMLLNKKHNPNPDLQNERNKRYVVKSKSKINNSIDSSNRSAGGIKLPNIFSQNNRLKRFK